MATKCMQHQRLYTMYTASASQPASERAAPPCAQLIKTNSFLVPLVFQVQCDTRQIIVVETPLRVASSKNKAGTRRRGGGARERERERRVAVKWRRAQDVACGRVNNRQH